MEMVNLKLPKEDEFVSEEEMEGLVSSPDASSFESTSRRKNFSVKKSIRRPLFTNCVLNVFYEKRKWMFVIIITIVIIMIKIDGRSSSVMTEAHGGQSSSGSPQSIHTQNPTGAPTASPVVNTEIVVTNTPSKSPVKSPAKISSNAPVSSEIITANDDNDEGEVDDILAKEDDEFDEEARKEGLIEQWGKWHFWDGDPDSRPTEDYMAKYPNRDCPSDEFPDSSWQVDAVYVNHMLDSAGELVSRVKEAIYTEYGWGPREALDHDGLKARMSMFHLSVIDLDDVSVSEPLDSVEKGGWIAQKSFKNLSRRILHAMMTGDTFTVVLGGDQSAAGHGNHFVQSYMMEFHKILEPVLARVGVKLITRNCAQEGIGTLHQSLGSGSLYGDDVDMIVWDSSMTETDEKSIGMFYRQALMAGKRAPVLWGGPFDLLKQFYQNVDADVMVAGNAMQGVQETTDEKQVKTLPFAIQYLKCSEANKDMCEDPGNMYRGTCWLERNDVRPPTTQLKNMKGQDDKYPGFRAHQIKARTMTMQFLDAMQDAIDTWSEITIVEGHPLPDEYWHITDHYENIKSKIISLDSTVGECDKLKAYLPERVCNTPMKARGEYTPRANPAETSLRTILKPTPDGFVPQIEDQMLYDGPDLPNPYLKVPHGEIDTAEIAGLRRRLHFRNTHSFQEKEQHLEKDSMNWFHSNLRRRHLEINAGKGWQFSRSLPGNCDGTYDAICGRLPSSDCLLDGHMDSRGGILGNELSGWLVFDVPDVKEGIIMLKFESNHLEDESTVTKDWSDINNGEYTRHLQSPTPLPEDFFFDYAIEGNITSLSLSEFQSKNSNPQNYIELITLLDDSEFEGPKNIEAAIRLRNCGRKCAFLVTHLYWA